MKSIFLSIGCVLGTWAAAYAQIKYPIDSAIVNPLAYPKEISANREIALIYDEKDDNNNIIMHHQFIDVNQLSIQDMNPNIALQTGFPIYNATPNNDGNRQIGICAGDFNGDHIDDYLSGTEGSGYEVMLRAYSAQVMGTQMTVNLGGSGMNVGHLTMTEGHAGIIRLAAGNFDGAADDEAVLLYREDLSDKLQITIYDFDAGMNLIQVGQISDETATLVQNYESYDLAVVDLDYDGTSELVIAGSQTDGGNRKPFVKVYDVELSGGVATITPRQKTFVPTTFSSSTRVSVAITTGDFNNDFIEEIALSYGYQVTDNNGNTPDTWLRLFRVGDDTLNTPGPADWLERTVLLPQSYQGVKNIDFLQSIDLDAGDVDGDGDEDIVLANNEELQLFSVSADFEITASSPLGSSYQNEQDREYTQMITVGDMNNDGKAEVLNVRNWVDQDIQQQYMSISIHLWNPQTLQWQVLAVDNDYLPMYYQGSGNLRQYAIAIGDFDGDNIFFGEYEHYVFTDIVQPIIILNAPPTHSDNIGEGDWTDVNGIWEDGDCSAFTSHYSETTDESFTVQTSISNAWSVSAALNAEFEGLVVSASASLESSYGENYTNTNATTSTTSEVTVTTTCFDDAVYASIVTYDVFEYPLYVGDTLICYVVSVHPRLNDIDFQWISTKSEMGQYFISKHEPGNILSYRPYNSPQFNLASQDEFNEGNNINLSTTISNAWEITTQQVQESSADTERNLGLAASASFGAFGISAEVSGAYNWTGISTHSSSVGDAIAVGLDIGTVPLASSDALYAVKPFIFWGEGDEVILDYEVNATGNFYEDNYSIQDPAWNMPWRLDVERGYIDNLNTSIRQSKSIWFDKKFPMPGDTITATARIFNYSLVATESPVEVKFFYGNPYNGGVEALNLDGVSTVTTAAPIASQQYAEVQMTFAMPEDFPYDGRLYARIDPDSTMLEVHEENNLSWRALGPYFPMVEDDYETTLPDNITEMKQENPSVICYPNPVASELQLWSNHALTSYQIIDMQGRVVLSESLQNNTKSVKLDVSHLSNGVYVVQCASKYGTSTSRFVHK